MNWARDLPKATSVRRDTPTRVTFVYPFYMNHGFLRTQLDTWRAYQPDLRRQLSVILVDDGSPTPAAEVVFGAESSCALRLFRIDQDVRWNWLAARNIGAHHAADGWLLLTDMDHVVPAETLREVLYSQHDPGVIYVFTRREHTGAKIAPHSASFLMTREMFWRVGGYDERLAGLYGSDGLWRRRCAATAPIHVLPATLIRHEYQGDSSTTRYQRKQPEDARLSALVASFPKDSAPTHLTFPYHEVAL